MTLSDFDKNFKLPTLSRTLKQSNYKFRTGAMVVAMTIKRSVNTIQGKLGMLHKVETVAEEDTIRIKFPGLFPENFDYDPKSDTFIMGSVVRGSLYRVDMKGNVSTLTNDPFLSGYHVATGIQIDSVRRIVLVTLIEKAELLDSTSDSAIAAYNLDSGARLFLTSARGVDKEEKKRSRAILSDIVVAKNGMAYVTDSATDRFFRVDLETGQLEVESRDPLLQRKNNNSFPPFHLQGIEYIPETNDLLLSSMADGTMMKYNIDTKKITFVGLSEPIRGDGYVWKDGDHKILILSVEEEGEMVRLESHDGWQTANVTAKKKLSNQVADITAPAIRHGEIWELRTHAEDAFRGVFNRTDFELQRIRI